MKVKVISLPYIFQVLYVLCFTNVKISGERLQDQWSSGFFFGGGGGGGNFTNPDTKILPKHIANTPMQYTVIFHSCKITSFQTKILLKTLIVGMH